ncbi:MAG: lipopolysaccharide kinase InaA family protein [Planctomycetota bacterium]|jgi:tRNA A-37 threonylcarbamoyl transferase component Bud32
MKVSAPAGFKKFEVGKTICILAEDEAEKLLDLGVANVESFLKGPDIKEFKGRTTVHGVPLDGNRRMVIRHYSHGGALRKITGDKFIGANRFINEIDVSMKAISAGVNAPVPLGVVYNQKLGVAQGDHLSVEIPGAISIMEKALNADQGKTDNIESEVPDSARYIASTILDIAGLVRKLHDAGIYHADLHIKNILDTPFGYYLIDFDGAIYHESLSAKLRTDNLFRMLRSVEKFLGQKILQTCFKPYWLYYCYEKLTPMLETSSDEFAKGYETHAARHRKRWEKTGGGYGT